MSKWANEFADQYQTKGNVKRLTQEIKDASNKDKFQKKIDKALSEVIKGKHKRKGGDY